MAREGLETLALLVAVETYVTHFEVSQPCTAQVLTHLLLETAAGAALAAALAALGERGLRFLSLLHDDLQALLECLRA